MGDPLPPSHRSEPCHPFPLLITNLEDLECKAGGRLKFNAPAEIIGCRPFSLIIYQRGGNLECKTSDHLQFHAAAWNVMRLSVMTGGRLLSLPILPPGWNLECKTRQPKIQSVAWNIRRPRKIYCDHLLFIRGKSMRKKIPWQISAICAELATASLLRNKYGG